MMKKIFVALMLLMLTGTASFGAVSDDVYVRKDVFDAKMEALFSRLHAEIGEVRGDIKMLSERIDRNFDTLSTRIDGLDKRIDDMNTSLSARIDGLDKRIDDMNTSLSVRIDGLDKRIDDMNTSLSARIDDLRNGIYLWLVAIGLVVTVIATVIAWPKLQEKLKTFWKPAPSITLEDIERLIDRKNAEFRKSLQL